MIDERQEISVSAKEWVLLAKRSEKDRTGDRMGRNTERWSVRAVRGNSETGMLREGNFVDER